MIIAMALLAFLLFYGNLFADVLQLQRGCKYENVKVIKKTPAHVFIESTDGALSRILSTNIINRSGEKVVRIEM